MRVWLVAAVSVAGESPHQLLPISVADVIDELVGAAVAHGHGTNDVGPWAQRVDHAMLMASSREAVRP